VSDSSDPPIAGRGTARVASGAGVGDAGKTPATAVVPATLTIAISATTAATLSQ
jgi:hypothetical protein